MSAPKLTEAQREELYPTDPVKLEAKFLRILARRTSPLGGYPLLTEHEHEAVQRLVARGHAECVTELSRYNLYAITDAGRAALRGES